ncbi:hypothetical protein, partial [Serratia marcescens]|uniref:hypothetical protein n=1 Tax=Serratia marcescens TaxID=615 RepID=UPI0023806524
LLPLPEKIIVINAVVLSHAEIINRCEQRTQDIKIHAITCHYFRLDLISAKTCSPVTRRKTM